LRPARIACPSRRRAGFTLVEVIVVLVILAILAAIAIPALTGYIDKANDKKYIAQARDISVAMKTVLNEAYASGKINSNGYGVHNGKDAFTEGEPFRDDETNEEIVQFSIEKISYGLASPPDGNALYKQAATLIGEAYPANENEFYDPGTWQYTALAQKDSGATAATADGFYWFFWPEGQPEGHGEFPLILVTYKLERIAVSEEPIDEFGKAFDQDSVYDPNAGYEVYKLTRTPPE
jgi:prepilin-type N-terminal cleavage/methylation domain-containing protein